MSTIGSASHMEKLGVIHEQRDEIERLRAKVEELDGMWRAAAKDKTTISENLTDAARRLRAINAELNLNANAQRARADKAQTINADLLDRMQGVQLINAELLAALETAESIIDIGLHHEEWMQVRAAITRAKP